MYYTVIAVGAGMLLDFFIGDPQYFLHPMRLVGKLIELLEKLFRRVFPKTKQGEYIAGIFLVLFVVLITVGIPTGFLVRPFFTNIIYIWF
jgi:adenosylcobinamide-phosphate synthase